MADAILRMSDILSRRHGGIMVVAGGIFGAAAFGASAEPCDKAAFQAAVAKASGAISSLNEENKKSFQNQLQALKMSAGWSDADYVAKATPFVKDERTTELDSANQALLAKVQTFSVGDAGSEESRCAMLKELEGVMGEIVANTRAKWDHMLAKVARATPTVIHAETIR